MGDFVTAAQATDFAWNFVFAMLGFGVGLLTADALRMDARRRRRRERRRVRRDC